MKDYENPEIYFIKFEANELITISTMGEIEDGGEAVSESA